MFHTVYLNLILKQEEEIDLGPEVVDPDFEYKPDILNDDSKDEKEPLEYTV